MRIGVLGAGYVGLVTGTCLAEMGNDVIIVDIAEEKINALREGKSPHYEPGLNDLLERNIEDKRLTFSTNVSAAVKDTEAIFLAVGTPMSENGSANLSYIEQAARDVAKVMDSHRVMIIKSTVPVGTNKRVADIVAEVTSQPFDIVSNPEFLKEGAAVDDFMYPDRVVVGVRTQRAANIMKQIYDPFVRTGRPIMLIDPESAEMVKYTANALLASRISFMNEMSTICAAVGADIDLVRKGVGTDRRIGPAFLFPGLGYGGSCFPKDVRALEYVAKSLGLEAPMCRAIDAINVQQRDVLMPYLKKEFGGDLKGKHFAIWGLAFKAKTDDVREAPALHMAKELVKLGATVTGFDPEANETTKKEIGDIIKYADNRYEALDGADALIVATEWNEFRSPDFDELKKRLKRPLMFDGRNIYDIETMRNNDFTYYSVGRPPVIQ